ncbi:MAG: tetratricopeptide repeat protein [Prevotella sp.]|nr:tetratricopeptide repeat protein [Prevotella sp.]
MKAIKYLLIGAVIFTSHVSTFAQDNNKMIIEQATQIIKNKGADFGKQVKQLYKDNKKNPEVLVAIGKLFLHEKDTANAIAFADYALKKDTKFAKAFLLKGDIAVAQDDAGKAAENYQQAKYFAPKDPEGYYKYAMILRGRSPEEAVANLEDLRVQRPDYPVDALAGRIYYIAQNYQKASSYYSKVTDFSKMEDEDLTNFAMTEWLLGNREKSIDICKRGLARNSRRAGWNRIAFYNYTDLKQADEALNYADKLFNQSDSAHIIGEDYIYYGTALQQAQRWDDAIKAYNQALNLDASNPKQLVIINKNLSDVYLGKGDYNNAITYFEKSFEGTEPTMENLDNLGTLYADIASKKTQAGDTEGAANAFRSADQVYARLMQAYPNYNNYCNFMRGQINANLDPNSKQGLAKPYYEELAKSLEAKAEKNDSEIAMMKQAYLYLIVYHFNVKQDKETSKVFANKMLTIDPENEVAKQVIAIK